MSTMELLRPWKRHCLLGARVYRSWAGKGRVVTLLFQIHQTPALSYSRGLEDWHKLFNYGQRRKQGSQDDLVSNWFDATFYHLFCQFLEFSGKIPGVNHSKLSSVLNHQKSGDFPSTASPWTWSHKADTNLSFVINKFHFTNTEIQGSHLTNTHMELLFYHRHRGNMTAQVRRGEQVDKVLQSLDLNLSKHI